MTTRSAAAAIGLALLALTAAGCGEPEPANADIPQPVTGLITQVGPDHIVLRTRSGQVYRFFNADTQIGTSHLEVHRRKKLPVQVTHEANGGRIIARRIEDVPSGGG